MKSIRQYKSQIERRGGSERGCGGGGGRGVMGGESGTPAPNPGDIPCVSREDRGYSSDR